MPLVRRSGVTYFRGGCSISDKINAEIVAACRKNGLKWLIIPANEDWSTTPEQTAARVAWFAANGADVVYGFEGVNEPNHERAGGPPPADWLQRTMAHQKAMWDAVKKFPSLAHAIVLGPSMHGTVTTEQDYVNLKAAGILGLQHKTPVHSYMGGDLPLRGLDPRLAMIRKVYGAATKFHVTETGWHNALETTTGHRPASEEACKIYGPRAVLMFAALGIPGVRFEFLDDPDPMPKNNQEANFGVMRVGDSGDVSTWAPKEEFVTVMNLLTALEDPGPDYTPADVPVKVEAPADVWWKVFAKRDGSAKVYLFRNVPVWDPNARVMLPVPGRVPVKITDAQGLREVQVNASVMAVTLRTATV
jgi:hypothetical protein